MAMLDEAAPVVGGYPVHRCGMRSPEIAKDPPEIPPRSPSPGGEGT